MALWLLAMSAQAQQIMICGQVTDAQTGESLQGANIYLKQQKRGATSDQQGKFKLTASLNGNTTEMRVSYVGYQTQHFQL